MTDETPVVPDHWIVGEDAGMGDFLNRAISETAWNLAAQREDALREVAREYLPRPLRWAVDHPRVLRVLYRVRRHWRPRVVTGTDGELTVGMVEGKDGTMYVTEQFRVERDDA